MKRSWILATVILLLFVTELAGQKPKDSARATSIEGVVVNNVGGQPIAGARVSLLKDPGIITRSGTGGPKLPPEISYDPYLWKAITTDAAGRFAFVDIDPKVYGMVFGANGYVRQEFGRDKFRDAGKSIVVRMTPTGSVSGVVRGDGSRPLANVTVQLLRYVYGDSGRKSLKPFGSARTNDLGEYRLYFIPPGRYYLRAGTYGQPNGDPFAEIVKPSFYPGVDDAAQAATVEVESGMEQFRLDFRLNRQPSYRIRGRIVESGSEHDPEANRSLRMYYIGGGFPTGDDVGNDWSFARPAADGTFEFRNIVPGLYAIAFGESPTRGLVSVQVGNSDIENVVIPLFTATVTGRIHVDGRPSTRDPGHITFNLNPLLPSGTAEPDSWLDDFTSLQSSASVVEDGRFEFEGVMPIDYRLESWLAPGYYIKSARLGGVDVLNHPFHSYNADDTLDVVLSSGVGEVSGTVVNEKQRPVGDIETVLVPERSRDRTDLYFSTTTDSDGKFSFDKVPPGDYKLFAWETLEENSWFDPEVLRHFEAKGKTLHVGESSKQSTQLKVIPATK